MFKLSFFVMSCEHLNHNIITLFIIKKNCLVWAFFKLVSLLLEKVQNRFIICFHEICLIGENENGLVMQTNWNVNKFENGIFICRANNVNVSFYKGTFFFTSFVGYIEKFASCEKYILRVYNSFLRSYYGYYFVTFWFNWKATIYKYRKMWYDFNIIIIWLTIFKDTNSVQFSLRFILRCTHFYFKVKPWIGFQEKCQNRMWTKDV